MIAALLAAALVALAGCAPIGSSTVRLLTDRGEMAAYAEVFNAAQRDLKIELVYSADPAETLRKSAPDVDLVVAEGLAATNMRDHFRPLADLFGRGRLDAGAFYEGLLATGRQDGTQYLLPLSFNLPLVVYRPSALGEQAPGPYVTPEYIRTKSAAFDAAKSQVTRKVGFSPLWKPLFIYYVAEARGVGFRSSDGRSLQWDEAALESTLAEFRAWTKALADDRLRDFDAKFLHIPYYRLVEDGRILFYLSDSREFLAIPPERRQNLEFRWLGEGDRIPLADDVLYAGTLRRARNPRGARRFLLWLFRPDVQTSLMEVNHFKRIPGVFGVAGGLPALVEVAERDLLQPNHYPVFVGHLPPREMLLAPPLRPPGWRTVRDSVLLPWLAEAAASDEPPRSLRKALEEAGYR